MPRLSRGFRLFVAHVLASYVAMTLCAVILRARGDRTSDPWFVAGIAPLSAPLVILNGFGQPDAFYGPATYLLLAGAYGAVLVRVLIRTGRVARRPGASARTCAKCGYDLRATPDRCPECGTVPAVRPPP